MSGNLKFFCLLEQEDSYQILKEALNEGESPEEGLLRTFKEKGLTIPSWAYRGILTLVREELPDQYIFLFGPQNSDWKKMEEGKRLAHWLKADKTMGALAKEEEKICLRLLLEELPFFSLKAVYNREHRLSSVLLNGKPLELFDILRKDGEKSGIVRERGVAHLEGSLHPTSHIWIVRKNQKGGWDLLLQKRSLQKDSNPGCYDISSAGHVAAGDAYLPAAIRELREELGILAEEGDLLLAGMRQAYFEAVFYGKPFRDYEHSAVYIYHKSVDEKKLVLQESEVSGIKWMEFEECRREVAEGSLKNCIYLDELEIVEEALKNLRP